MSKQDTLIQSYQFYDGHSIPASHVISLYPSYGDNAWNVEVDAGEPVSFSDDDMNADYHGAECFMMGVQYALDSDPAHWVEDTSTGSIKTYILKGDK